MCPAFVGDVGDRRFAFRPIFFSRATDNTNSSASWSAMWIEIGSGIECHPKRNCRTAAPPPSPKGGNRSSSLTIPRAGPRRAPLDSADDSGTQLLSYCRGVVRRDDRHHPDAHVEDLIHLAAIDASALLHDLENRRHFPALRLDDGVAVVGRMRGRLSINPPPVMWARPFSFPRGTLASSG